MTFITFLLAVFLSLSLAACGTSNRDDSSEADVSAGSRSEPSMEAEMDATEPEEVSAVGSNVLIAYLGMATNGREVKALSGKI